MNKHLWNPEPPCPCHWCQEWITEFELFWIVGEEVKNIICEQCLELLRHGAEFDDLSTYLIGEIKT